MISKALTIAALSVIPLLPAAAQENQSKESGWDNTTAVPPEIVRDTRAFREKLLADPYRPAYHFCVPEDQGLPGDPNGAFYHKGRYHLMYLYNREGSGFAWGHVSSKDMLHWRHHPDAIGPGNGDEGCFSGGAFVDTDGTAVLSYWMLWGGKGIGLATSNDPHFDHWTKFTINPVIQSTEWGLTDTLDKSGERLIYGSADPSNIWIKDGKYYMLTGNLLVLEKYGRQPDAPAKYQGDWLDLFVSEDLREWEYVHRFYQSDRSWTESSEDNMCPSFLPLPASPDGGKMTDKHMLLFISHNMGCQYYIGDYSSDRFFPTTHGRMTWVDKAYFAPEALVDDQGRNIMWAWVFDDRPEEVRKSSGWTGMFGLPRSLWLRDDGTLGIQPVRELEQLRLQEETLRDIDISSGGEFAVEREKLHELMEIEISIPPNGADRFGVRVCISEDGKEQTAIYYDRAERTLKFDTRRSSLLWGKKVVESAPLTLEEDETLHLRIFVDRSIVEVFANDRQAIARTVYPTLGGKGVSAFTEGGDISIESLRIWEMMPSNPY